MTPAGLGASVEALIDATLPAGFAIKREEGQQHRAGQGEVGGHQAGMRQHVRIEPDQAGGHQPGQRRAVDGRHHAARRGEGALDPRRQELMRHASHPVQFKPGADVAMLNALLHVIVAEKLYDEQYIQANVSGFEAFGEECDRRTRAELMDECLEIVCGLLHGGQVVGLGTGAENRISVARNRCALHGMKQRDLRVPVAGDRGRVAQGVVRHRLPGVEPPEPEPRTTFLNQLQPAEWEQQR